MLTCAAGHASPACSASCANCGEGLDTSTALSTTAPGAPTTGQCMQGHPLAQGDGFCPTCGSPAATPAPVVAFPPSVAAYPSAAALPRPVQAAPAQPLQAGDLGYGASYQAGAPTQPAGPGYQFQLARLTTLDRITGAAAVALMLSLLFHWYGNDYGYHRSGLSGHGWLALVFLSSGVLIAYMAIRAGFDRFPVALPIAHAPLLILLGGFQLLLVLLALLAHRDQLHLSFGAYVGAAAALGTFLPVGIPFVKSLTSQ